ncbi:MAG: transglutaminase-like domain-containing protein [Planctomycetaceae bacterium]
MCVLCARSSRLLMSGLLLFCRLFLSDANLLQADDHWYRIEFDGQPAGHELVVLGQFEDPVSGRLRRFERETVLRLRRLGADLSVRAKLTTEESEDGRLFRWSLQRTSADGLRIQRSGVWQESSRAFVVRDGTGSSPSESLVECSEQPRSPLISGWLMSAFPQGARVWTSPVFFPESNESAELEFAMTSKVYRTSETDGSGVVDLKYEFRPVDFREVEASTLIFQNQRYLGSDQRVLGAVLSIRRAEPAQALGYQNTEALDLQLRTLVPVTGKVEWGFDQTIKLLVQTSPELRGILESSDFQRVEEGQEGQIRVVLLDPAKSNSAVRTVQKLTASELAEYLGSGKWVDAANSEILRTAVLAAGNTSDRREKCRRLVQHVSSRMQFSALSTLQQPASTVLKSLKGDCTEHAVLLAALLRAEKIPSRVAVGFLYVPRASAFAPHMWVEAFVDGGWVPLDSTIPTESESVPRIRVSHSSLAADATGCVRVFADVTAFPGRTEVSVELN